MMRAERVRAQPGYTLAEMMVVCAIVGLVMASLLSLVMAGRQAYWYGTTQVDGQQTVRVAMERMVKDIREAGYEPVAPESDPASCPSAVNYPLYASVPCYRFYPITGQSATALTLQYNWNASTCANPCTPVETAALVRDPMLCPVTACRGEQVTYSLSGTDLRRQESVADASPVIIASGITALSFTYRDENGNVTASQELMRSVDISMTARTATNGATVTMTDRVRLRNR
jgi:prepilin-type N-terminal cleavage/methylation domain-containing protein